MNLPTQVQLQDVGPRDGLQNEPQNVPTHIKLEFIQRLQDAGLKRIEVASFVSPKWVPQMADSAAVMAALPRKIGVRYSVLVPNQQGFEAAAPFKPDEIEVFTAASETFCQRNTNCSIEQSLERFKPVVAAGLAQGITVRGSISCALGCPYEGDIAPAQVATVARALKGLGVQHLSVADTIGVGTPRKVQQVMQAVMVDWGAEHISGHFHDTYGQALANILACLQLGLWQFDSSCAGLGGCPYARGASGNVATEDLVYMLHGMGIETGIDLNRLVQAGQFISNFLGHPPHSRAARALLAQ